MDLTDVDLTTTPTSCCWVDVSQIRPQRELISVVISHHYYLHCLIIIKVQKRKPVTQ